MSITAKMPACDLAKMSLYVLTAQTRNASNKRST